LLNDTGTPAGDARPIWTVLENEAPHPKRLDPGHWVSVYTNLLALLSGGARVSIGERTSGDLVTVDPGQVSERLEYWQARIELV
jgi:hypothetical protein